MDNPKGYENQGGNNQLASLINLKIKKILVAVDDSENSKRAGNYAIKLGKELHADAMALHVISTGKYLPSKILKRELNMTITTLIRFLNNPFRPELA
jgi:K+-sensing histidine kinase KdpD